MGLWGALMANATLTVHAAGWLEDGLTFGYEKFIKAQFTNCMHGRAMAVARQARGEAFSSSSRWNHRR